MSDQQLTVQKVDGPQQFRLTSDLGARPRHSTSAGKAPIAFAAPAGAKRLVEHPTGHRGCPRSNSVMTTLPPVRSSALVRT